MLLIAGYALGLMLAAGVLFLVVWFVFGRGEDLAAVDDDDQARPIGAQPQGAGGAHCSIALLCCCYGVTYRFGRHATLRECGRGVLWLRLPSRAVLLLDACGMYACDALRFEKYH